MSNLVEELDEISAKLDAVKAKISNLGSDCTENEVAAFIQKGNTCKKCEWIDSDVLLPGNEHPEVRPICFECGAIANFDLMLNATALQRLRSSIENANHMIEVEGKIAVNLEFEMSRFFNEWDNHFRERLLTALQPGGDIQKRHELYNLFLHQGLEASNVIREQLIQEVLVGKKD